MARRIGAAFDLDDHERKFIDEKLRLLKNRGLFAELSAELYGFADGGGTMYRLEQNPVPEFFGDVKAALLMQAVEDEYLIDSIATRTKVDSDWLHMKNTNTMTTASAEKALVLALTKREDYDFVFSEVIDPYYKTFFGCFGEELFNKRLTQFLYRVDGVDGAVFGRNSNVVELGISVVVDRAVFVYKPERVTFSESEEKDLVKRVGLWMIKNKTPTGHMFEIPVYPVDVLLS